MAAAGAFDDFCGWAEDFFCLPDGFAWELIQLSTHRLGAAVVAVVVEDFLGNRVTTEQCYREDQDYDFPKHGCI